MKMFYEFLDSPSELPPIIFLHGLCDSRISWKKVAPEIVKRTRRKVYLPDARDHGKSPWTYELNYDVLVKDLEEFMNDQNIKTAIIIGHSMGGRTALYFALKHPERTEAIIVEDMTPKNISSGTKSLARKGLEIVLEFLKSIPSELSLEKAKWLLIDGLLALAGDNFVNEDKIRKNIDLDIIPITKEGDSFIPLVNFEAVANMLQSNALVQNLPDSGLVFNGDALFLYGSKSFYKIGTDATINRLFPKAMKVEVKDSCHYLHMDNPDVFIQLVADFILHTNLPKSKY